MPSKLVAVDLLRIASAFSVLIWHYQHFYYSSTLPQMFIRSSQPLYRQLSFFYDYGLWGVQVFWCISGFVFFYVYADRILARKMPFGRFLINRISRLYPLHFCTLVLALLLQTVYLERFGYFFVYQVNDVKHFLLQLFLASHWGLERGTSFNGPIWSVSVEMIVYVFFWAILSLGLRSWIVNIICMSIGMLAVKFHLLGYFGECLAFFYAGGLAAVVTLDKQRSKIRVFCYVTLVILAQVIVLISFLKSSPWATHLLILANAPIVIGILSGINCSPKVSDTIEKLSNCTYSTYLLHFPIQLIIKLAISAFNLPNYYTSPSGLIIFILITYLIGYISFTMFEKPAQDFIRRVCSI